jgi:glycosyltransferase involved in cell wall biosynthesis
MRLPNSRTAPGLAGVNVVGYHGADSGLGQVARSITQSLGDAGLDVIPVEVAETLSPARASGSERMPAAPGPLHPVTIAVVTAAQLPAVAELHPEPFDPARLRIGYWFWELSIVPATQAPAFAFIDRVWAPSTFVQDAYISSGPTPVELQPPYIPEPERSSRTRPELGLTDRFTFLTSFDHLSVVERKNPTTVITAFREAFPNRDDVALMVKSINADRKPASARQVRDAADGDPRISIVDIHLPADDHAALVAHADCFVSLHRSEGLGLHLAEAMWLGTPVIATAYSGNLDLMDDESAALVEASLTPVLNGEGAYPEGELWGQPNIIEATEWLRRMASDRSLCDRLAAAARARMESQPGSAEVGRRMRASLEVHAAHKHPAGPISRRLRTVARSATAPVRGYVNTHFEMTKREVRLQTDALAHRQEQPLQRLADTIDSIANSVAEVHVHQTRSMMDLRDEMVEVQHQLTELRADLNLLTDALVRLTETPPQPR